MIASAWDTAAQSGPAISRSDTVPIAFARTKLPEASDRPPDRRIRMLRDEPAGTCTQRSEYVRTRATNSDSEGQLFVASYESAIGSSSSEAARTGADSIQDTATTAMPNSRFGVRRTVIDGIASRPLPRRSFRQDGEHERSRNGKAPAPTTPAWRPQGLESGTSHRHVEALPRGEDSRSQHAW